MAHFPFSRFRSLSVRTQTLLSSAILAGAVVFLAGCHHAVTDPKDPKFIVAEKQPDWQITRADLNTEIANFLKARQATPEQVGPAKMLELESVLLNNLALKKLLLAKAATLPLQDVDKDEATALDQLQQRVPPGQTLDQQLKTAGLTMDDLKQRLHESIVIQKVLQSEALKNVQPSDQEIDAFYMQNKDKFIIPAKIRASRVLVLVNDKTSPADKAAKEKAINAAHARVLKGEDFSKVASEVSEDQYSKPRGGDIGFFQAGESESPEFDQIAFSTKVGQVSAVFETPLGYQFLKVTDSHPSTQLTAAEARPYIAKGLTQQKQQAAVKAYTDNLLATSGVTFHLVRVDPTQQAPDSNSAQPQAPPAQ